jgi:hypothetical protein
MESNTFFKEMTLRICSTLDIEKALVSCYEYLKNIMPIDTIQFFILDPDFKKSFVLAAVENGLIVQGNEWLSLNISKKNRETFLEYWAGPQTATIINSKAQDKLSRAIYQHAG